MQAWTYDRSGPLRDILTLQHDFPKPTASDLKPNEALIKVSHVTLTAAFANIMTVIPHFNSTPKIPEHRFAGTIVKISLDTSTPLAAGDQVFGMINPKQRGYSGVLAEYVVVTINSVVRKPNSISPAQASGVGGYATTPIEFAERAGLIEIVDGRMLNRAAGRRVLVTGGNTSLGHFTIQLMRWLVGEGGEIVATCSGRSKRLVKELGAHRVIDYTTVPLLHEYLLGESMFDAIIDIAGTDAELFPKCPAYLKEDGFFVFAGNIGKTHVEPGPGLGALMWLITLVLSVLQWLVHMSKPLALGGVPRRAAFISGTPSQQNLRIAQQLIEEGVLRSIVDSEWEMEDLLEAYEHLANGPICGKVVVKVQT